MGAGQSVDELQQKLPIAGKLERMGILNQLSEAYLTKSIDSSLTYAYEFLNLAEENQQDSLIFEAHYCLFNAYRYEGQPDSVLVHALLGKEVSDRMKLPAFTAFSYSMIATGYGILAQYDKKIEYLKKGIKIWERENDFFELASMYYNTARVYKKTGDFELALDAAIKAETLFVKMRDEHGHSVTDALIAEIYEELGQQGKAKNYLKKALGGLDKTQYPYEYADALMGFGYLYLKASSLDSAQIYFAEALALGKNSGSLIEIAKAHDSMGEVFLQKKVADSCYYHLHRAHQILSQLGNEHGLTYTYKNLGAYFALIGHRDSTEYYYLKSLKLSEEINLVKVQEEVLPKLVTFYEKNHQFEKALNFHKRYFFQVNETKGLETQKAIAELETKYESEKKERKIERLELQSAIQESKTNTFRIGLLGVALVASLIVFGVLYRRKNERKFFFLKQKVHEQERKKLNQELSYKTKQLTSHALHMVQKNKVLQELKSGINDVAKTADSSSKKALRSLIRRINFNIQADEDWNTFKLYFEQTNQNFYAHLAEIAPDLTSTELKLCSLIKLNMNIKETASVLNIEPTSVKTARHRLRKKLKLEQGQDLTVFIRQLT